MFAQSQERREGLAHLENSIAERRDHMPGTITYLTRIERDELSSGRFSRAPQRYRNINFPGRDEARFEVQDVGGDLSELWAIAAKHVTKRHPEVFGTIENWDAWEAQGSELKAKLDELLGRIATEFAPDRLDHRQGAPRRFIGLNHL